MMNRVIGKVLTKARGRDKNRARRLMNKDAVRAYQRDHYQRNKTQIRLAQKTYNALHSTDNKERCSRHYKKNKRDRMKKHLAYKAKRRKNDAAFVAYERAHSRLANFLKKRSKKKTTPTARLVGMSASSLVRYLSDSQDTTAIIGKHVDHIFAIARYKHAEDESRAMHFSNLQLLTPQENIWKKDRLPTKAMAAKVERWAWPDGITEADLPDIYPGWSTPLRM